MAQPWSCSVAFAACGVTRPGCFWKLIRRTWSLRSTCFACLQPGRASWLWPEIPCSVYPDGDTNQWVCVAFTTVPLEWVGAVVVINILPDVWCSNIAGVPRGSAVSSAGSFHPLHSLVCMNGLDVVGYSNVLANDTPSVIPRFQSCMYCSRASSPRWEMGGQDVLCTHSQRMHLGLFHTFLCF